MNKLYSVFIVLFSAGILYSAQGPEGLDYEIFHAVELAGLRPNALAKAVKDGANVNARNQMASNQTVLMRAVQLGNPKTVEFLLDHKADIYAKDNHGQIALDLLYVASVHDYSPTIELFLKHGFNINHRLSKNNTLLIKAADMKDCKSVKMLLAKGADVSLKNNEGKSALDIALAKKHCLGEFLTGLAGQRNIRAVKEIISKDPSAINTQDALGNTALHYAVGADDSVMVLYLLSHNADSAIKNKSGETPIDWARGGHHKMLKLFVKAAKE